MSRVLVACEFSGIVSDAFRRAGHEAYSVDLIEPECDHPWHLQGDALDMLDGGWDLLIAHPPCTYLANSGVRWLYGGKGPTPDPERWREMEEASFFFAEFLLTAVPRVAVENPVMHGHARRYIQAIEVINGPKAIPDIIQTIQPWQFGHGETKATQIWLQGLPPLVPTNVVDGREQRVHRMPPGPDRWKERSRTFPGIAQAMADQWGPLLGTATIPTGQLALLGDGACDDCGRTDGTHDMEVEH